MYPSRKKNCKTKRLKIFPMCLKWYHLFQSSYKMSSYVLTFVFITLLFLNMRKIQNSVLTYETLLYFEPWISQDKIISVLGAGWRERLNLININESFLGTFWPALGTTAPLHGPHPCFVHADLWNSWLPSVPPYLPCSAPSSLSVSEHLWLFQWLLQIVPTIPNPEGDGSP